MNTSRIYQAILNISELTAHWPLIADLVSVDPADKALLSLHYRCTLVAGGGGGVVGGGRGAGSYDNTHCTTSPTEYHSLGIVFIIMAIICLCNGSQT